MINGHGDDAYKYGDIRIDLSSNVYTGFNQEGLRRHLATELDVIGHYPEPVAKRLETDLAERLGIRRDNIVVTSGATEAIYLTAQTYRHAHSAILVPTFAEYADACTMHEHKTTNILTLKQLPASAQIVWLCNPNNPTGETLDIDELRSTIEKRKDTLFVIDASYAAFTTRPTLRVDEALEYDNVMMIHSLTKRFGVPGLRLGYMTGAPGVVQKIGWQRMPWSVNHLAQSAGHYLLEHIAEYAIPVETLNAERKRVAERLTGTGAVETWPSDTHMLLCRLRMGKSSGLKEFLAKEKGILIRDASNFEGLDTSFFRIAVQNATDDDELIKGVEEWIF